MRTRRCGTTRTVLAAGVALSVLGCGPRGAEDEPGLVLGDCAVVIPDAKCGVLEVEENRDAPNGRTIPLAIVVAEANGRRPADDPVFVLAGGPGQGAAELAPMILHRFAQLQRGRDLVFVDIRGTGNSGPLACEFEDPEDLVRMLAGEANLDVLDACLAAYPEGIDLHQYSTANIVEDLDAVREALGYDQVNLLGISYGTRVAQIWMQRHPDHVRSAVLDGVAPIDVNVLLETPADNERALTRVLADCREAPDCAAAFPGLERKLETLLTDLDQNRALEAFVHPQTGVPTRVDFTRAGFTQVLAGSLYSPHFAVLIPWLIERAHAGDYAPAVTTALALTKMSKSLSMGLYLSVACSEDFDHIGEAERAAAIEGLRVFDDHSLAVLAEACARWPHATLPTQAPLESEVPTLLLSGAYDPVTPAKFAEHLLSTLSDARHIEVETGHHGVWNVGCATRLLAGFYDDPRPAAVDPSCFDDLAPMPMFINANGPRARVADLEDEPGTDERLAFPQPSTPSPSPSPSPSP